MSEPIKDFLRLKTSKGPLALQFCVMLAFLLIAVFAYPSTPLFWVLRIITVAACTCGMIVFFVGITTSRYDALLDHDGIEFGTFRGKQRYQWDEIKSVLVVNAVSGQEVCLELKQVFANPKNRGFRRLPETYGMKADELAKTILYWKREYSVGGDNN